MGNRTKKVLSDEIIKIKLGVSEFPLGTAATNSKALSIHGKEKLFFLLFPFFLFLPPARYDTAFFKPWTFSSHQLRTMYNHLMQPARQNESHCLHITDESNECQQGYVSWWKLYSWCVVGQGYNFFVPQSPCFSWVELLPERSPPLLVSSLSALLCASSLPHVGKPDTLPDLKFLGFCSSLELSESSSFLEVVLIDGS